MGIKPVPGSANSADNVKTNRLPRIGDSASIAPEATPDADDKPDDRPPVERFARSFENPDGKPLFAILLQDTGEGDLNRQAIAALDFPVTFIIDPSLENAQSSAEIYRAAGQEVVMLASGLPEGGTASDLAVTFEAYARVLPEAVAVIDVESAGFQGNRPLAASVVPIIEDQGRGVLSWDKGLNAASQIARRDGVKNAVVFRRLDADNEAAPLIRRYLDRAAFKAAQDGRVAVVGSTRPETVAALLEWAIEGRAATIALAPVTAVMTSQ